VPDGSIKFLPILRALATRKVDFVLIGGVAAVVRGAPITTLDIDIVHLRSEDNVARLGSALAELGAWYREHPDRKPGPELGLMLGRGHHLFMTHEGPLDVIGETVDGLTFEELDRRSDTFELEPGLRVRVLSLQELVRIKESLFRDKDKLTLAILRQVLKDEENEAQAGRG
jgi:hypothetical protein